MRLLLHADDRPQHAPAFQHFDHVAVVTRTVIAVAGQFQVALYRGLVVAQSAAAGFTVVIAGVTAALSSIRCAKSRSAAKCCFAIASGVRFSLWAISLQAAYRATRPEHRSPHPHRAVRGEIVRRCRMKGHSWQHKLLGGKPLRVYLASHLLGASRLIRPPLVRERAQSYAASRRKQFEVSSPPCRLIRNNATSC